MAEKVGASLTEQCFGFTYGSGKRSPRARKGLMKTTSLISVSIGLSVLFISEICQAAELPIDGYLIDRKCMASVLEDPHPEDFIKHHTKDCSLMANCKKQGYSIYTNRRWLTLDRHGNKLAISLLEKSTRRNSFYVRVFGTVVSDRLKVKTIEEIEAPLHNESSVEAK